MVVERGAAGDARARALALLWDQDRRGARGPARGLTLDQIVGAAIELARRDGTAALSLRRVAGHLGVAAASLYTYVPGRAELEALMIDAVAVTGPLPHEWPGDWRAKLEATARAEWRDLRDDPWVLELSGAEQVPGPNMMRWLDSALRIFDGVALGEPRKLAAIESVDAYVRGAARLQRDSAATAAGATEGEGESEGGEGDGGGEGLDASRERDQELGRLVDFSRFPALGRALAAGAVPYARGQFDFGLQRLLDGIEGLIGKP
ncbi:TetR/AcrR family transcriptional regulator [Streptomyces sp. NPDC093252]|uniref:TetR/AcrR family transcriptional regulator n=1 Tax=Streptomyces sp. NPDC093252 TaxID=3154980 RepID=UPI003443EAA0